MITSRPLSPREMSIVLATILFRNKNPRARMSAVAVKLLNGNNKVHEDYVARVRLALEDFGWQMFRLDPAAYGFLKTSIAEGAPPAPLSLMELGEREALSNGSFDYRAHHDALIAVRDTTWADSEDAPRAV